MNYKHPQFKDMSGRRAQLFESEEGERILRLITQLSASPDGSATEELKKAGARTKRVGVLSFG